MNRVFLYFISLLLAHCSKGESKNYEKDLDACQSNSEAESIIHDGKNREYLLYLPDSYDGSSPIPLLFNFHGFGGRASDHILYADMRSVADSAPFILVYPQGSCLDGATHWNSCPIGGDNKSNADDFGFFETLLEEIASQYNIAMDRVYAVGYSNGGMMAYGLANYKSDLIAAVASVSGVMLDCIGSTQHPMPVVHFHGTSDYVIPYLGGVYGSVAYVLDHWKKFNQTTPNPIVNSESDRGMTIEHHIYDQGDRGVSVEHYKYEGGEHVWFSATYQGQNTATLIWNFLSRYDIDGLR